MPPPKFEFPYCEHAPTTYQRGTTYVEKKVRVEATCEFYRQEPETATHVLWTCPFSQGTCGLWSEDEFRDAATRSLTLTSSCSSNICRQFWRKQTRTGGQSRLGAFGMQEINFTSSMCSYSQRLSWNELLVCQQNIKHLCQPYAMLAYLYYCVRFNKTFYPSLKKKKKKKINKKKLGPNIALALYCT